MQHCIATFDDLVTYVCKNRAQSSMDSLRRCRRCNKNPFLQQITYTRICSVDETHKGREPIDGFPEKPFRDRAFLYPSPAPSPCRRLLHHEEEKRRVTLLLPASGGGGEGGGGRGGRGGRGCGLVELHDNWFLQVR